MTASSEFYVLPILEEKGSQSRFFPQKLKRIIKAKAEQQKITRISPLKMMTDGDDSGVSLSNLDRSSLSELNPLVFQCSQCNTVVGDSLSWVSADKVMRTLALAYVTSKVGVKSEIAIGSNGREKGSTYYGLYCLQCNEQLGKKYVASAPDIDFLRGHFCLDAEKLNSYKLGTYDKCTDGLADMVSCPNPREISQQIAKVKYLLVSINERVTAVEEKLKTNRGGLVSSRSLSHQVREEETARETDSQDVESVTSTENISSRFSYSSESEALCEISQAEKDKIKHTSDLKFVKQNRTLFSPEKDQRQLREIANNRDNDFIVPSSNKCKSDTDRVGRNRSSQSSRQNCNGESETGMEKYNRRPKSGLIRKGRGRHHNQCSAGSQSGRQHSYAESENDVTEFDGEPGSVRMERWPHDEHGAVAKKRKRITSPLKD